MKILKVIWTLFILIFAAGTLNLWFQTVIVGKYYLSTSFIMNSLAFLALPLTLFITIYSINIMWKGTSEQ